MEYLVYISIGFFLGGITVFFITKIFNKRYLQDRISSADKILIDAQIEAENIKNNKILQAKEKFLDLKSQHEKYILSKEAENKEKKQNLKLKESEVDLKSKKIEKLKLDLEDKIKTFNKKL